MPYTPYTLQTLLSSVLTEDPSAQQQQQQPHPPTPSSSSPIGSPPALFSRRSPPSSISDVSKSFSSSPSRLNNLLSGTAGTASFAVDAVEAWDTNLYIGTSDGHVLHYTLEERTSSSDQKSNVPHASRLENKINLGFGRKPVERILVIPQVSKAVVLCDSTLSFYSLPFFDPIPVSLISHIKGVACFAHNIAQEGAIGEDGTVELCVVKRRVLQIYKIGEQVQKEKELPLPDGAITLVWHGRNICLADVHIYKLINLQLSNATPLFPIPQFPASPSSASSMLSSAPQMMPRPVLTFIKPDEFLVISGSVNNQTIGVFINAYGDPVRGTLQWSSYPKSVCVEFPYIAALLRNHTIEIHNILDQTLLQIITLEPHFEARGMSFSLGIKVWMDGLAKRLTKRPWPESTDLEEQDDELNYDLRRKVARYSTLPARILIYGRDSVMAQLVKPLVVQVDELLDNNRVEEALEMADQARNAMSTENNIHIERLRCELDFIYQKAGLLLLKETLFDDAFSLLSKGDLDPRVVIHLFANLSQPKCLRDEPRILLFEGVRDIYESIGHIEDLVNRENEENGSTSELQRVMMANAREALAKYLAIERGKLRDKIGLGTTICKAIDTTLLKLYVYTDNDEVLHRMLQRPNDCCLQECSDTLRHFKKYYALSLLYQSKRAYEQVLETWTEMYSNNISDANFNGLQQIKQLLLQDISPEYLHQSVIVRYAWWLTEQSMNDGVEIFIRSPRASEMDSREILNKLEHYGDAAVRKYLEYLVLTRQSKESEHHTHLTCSYVRDVQSELETDDNGKQRLRELVDEYKRSRASLGIADAQPFVKFLGAHETSELVRRRLKLIRLLQRSPLYEPERLLEAIKEAGPLDIEMVIVYGRMKRHREALDILIKDISDYGGAETYCVTNGQSTGTIPDTVMIPPARSSSLQGTSKRKKPKKKKEDQEPGVPEQQQHLQERRELFSILLRLYLTLENKELCLNRTMHLLVTQGCYLDITEVLDLIPDDWPIQMLQDFLIRSLRRSLHAYKNSQIVVGISRGENLKIGSELIDLYNDIGPVQVDVDTVCRRCRRYLGDCIVVREPRNGDLLDLQCAEKLGLLKDTAINER